MSNDEGDECGVGYKNRPYTAGGRRVNPEI